MRIESWSFKRGESLSKALIASYSPGQVRTTSFTAQGLKSKEGLACAHSLHRVKLKQLMTSQHESPGSSQTSHSRRRRVGWTIRISPAGILLLVVINLIIVGGMTYGISRVMQ